MTLLLDQWGYIAPPTPPTPYQPAEPTFILDMGFVGGGWTTWENITSYLRRFSYSRGRSRERERMGVGTATLVLDNRDGAFDADNTSSPFAPNVRPNRRVRLRLRMDPGIGPWRMGRSPLGAWDAIGGGHAEVVLFTGRTEGGPLWTHISKADSTVTWSCVDDSKRLNRDRGTSGFGSGNALAGVRVAEVLDGTQPVWPDDERVLDAGTRTVQEATGEQGRFDYLLSVAESEGGSFYFDGRGRATFRDAEYVATPEPVPFGDVTGEEPYSSIVLEDDDAELFNRVTVSAPGLDNVVAEDLESELEFGRADLSVATLLSNEPDMESLAAALVTAYSQPRRRIRELGFRGPARYRVLRRDLFDRVIVRFRPDYGNAIQQESVIQGISVDSTHSRSWKVRWALSPPVPLPVSTNLLTEAQATITPDASGWTAEAYCTIEYSEAFSYTGSSSLAISGDYFAQALVATTPYTTASVTPGTSYRATAYVRAGALFLGWIYLSWRDAGGTQLSVTSANFEDGPYYDPTAGWKRLVVTGTAPAGAAYAVVRIGATEPYSEKNIKFLDGVSLREV